ncbi:MAG: hypothetical protein HQM10_02360 [Candidatus Riflebacteria bacterium]|nr:hypothetical protein [Candidatus Riflebacteria bacterium]
MIREFFRYLFFRCSSDARRLGYLYELIAFEARIERLEKFWVPHFEKCRNFISEGIKHVAGAKRNVVVLGAGTCLEIPLEKLVESFEEVWLVDMLFSEKIRKTFSIFKNLHFVETDVLAGWHKNSERLFKDFTNGNVRDYTHYMPDTKDFWQKLPCEIDLLVSANMLSQLSLFPEEFLLKKHHHGKAKSWEETVNQFSSQLFRLHLTDLFKASKVLIIISDIKKCIFKKNNTVEQVQLYPEMVFNSNDFEQAFLTDEWNWNFAPSPEISLNESHVHKVKAGLWKI